MSIAVHSTYRDAVNEATEKATASSQAIVVWQCGSQWAAVSSGALGIPWSKPGMIRPVLIVDSKEMRRFYSLAALVTPLHDCGKMTNTTRKGES